MELEINISPFHGGPENFKKSRQKKIHEIKKKIHETAFLAVLNYSQFKNWFLAIFEIAKKFFSWNWFIWFREFF